MNKTKNRGGLWAIRDCQSDRDQFQRKRRSQSEHQLFCQGAQTLLSDYQHTSIHAVMTHPCLARLEQTHRWQHYANGNKAKSKHGNGCIITSYTLLVNYRLWASRLIIRHCHYQHQAALANYKSALVVSNMAQCAPVLTENHVYACFSGIDTACGRWVTSCVWNLPNKHWKKKGWKFDHAESFW